MNNCHSKSALLTNEEPWCMRLLKKRMRPLESGTFCPHRDEVRFFYSANAYGVVRLVSFGCSWKANHSNTKLCVVQPCKSSGYCLLFSHSGAMRETGWASLPSLPPSTWLLKACSLYQAFVVSTWDLSFSVHIKTNHIWLLSGNT